MNPQTLWALAALAAGWAGWGWRGLVLATTVIAFWLLLQFSRALRTLRVASGRPVGVVDSAVMLNARLHAGMRLPQVLALTRSLGRRVGDDPEAWQWHDSGGDTLRVELRRGRVSAWQLSRANASAAPSDGSAA